MDPILSLVELSLASWTELQHWMLPTLHWSVPDRGRAMAAAAEMKIAMVENLVYIAIEDVGGVVVKIDIRARTEE